MHILLTNDDGIRAPGLLALRQELLSLGKVTIVAPQEECSGIGHSITIGSSIAFRKVRDEEGNLGYAVEGTPADCVKIALAGLLQESFDIVVSGINWGANAGMNLLYSGTVAAALEAAWAGRLGVAASLERGPEADFCVAARTTRFILETFLERKVPQGSAFSINIPARPLKAIEGISISPQSTEFFKEAFKRFSLPDGRQAFSLIETGEGPLGTGASERVLLSQGYVTITPLTFDLSERTLLARLKKWFWARRFKDFVKRSLNLPL